MRYVYLDESEFSQPSNLVGYGSLTTDGAIPDSLIHVALERLRNDPDINDISTMKIDKKTLSSGYFHASEDSKNSHSHLCSQINNEISGVFHSHFFDYKEKNERIDKLLDLASNLSSLKSLSFREKVKLIFERRGALTETFLKKSFGGLYDSLHYSSYDHPYIPTFFPEIEFNIVNKRNPGVQCTDFLLWAINRHLNKDSLWFNRIKTKLRMEFSSQSKDWGGCDFDLNNSIVEPKSYYTITDMPKNDEEIVTNEMLVNFYLHAEKVNSYFAQNDLPNGISYIKNNLLMVYQKLKDSKDSEHITNLAKNYIQLFDMVPLIGENTSQKDKEFLLLSKKYLSLILRRDLIHGVRTNMYLSESRRIIIKDRIDLLEF